VDRSRPRGQHDPLSAFGQTGSVGRGGLLVVSIRDSLLAIRNLAVPFAARHSPASVTDSNR